MVSKSSNQCKAINWLFLVLLFIFVVTTTLVVAIALFGRSPNNGEAPDTFEEVVEGPEEPEIAEEPLLPDAINFQSIVDDWANSVSGNRSVLVYDLERDEVAGSYNPDESYNTASLYKLFVVYEGYHLVQSGKWAGED